VNCISYMMSPLSMWYRDNYCVFGITLLGLNCTGFTNCLVAIFFYKQISSANPSIGKAGD